MNEKKGRDILKWKGEISFEGTLDQFQAFKETLSAHPIKVTIPEIDLGKLKPGRFAGYWPIPIPDLLGGERFRQLTEGAPRLALGKIHDIAGGIRTPHLHLGEEIVLVDKAAFKSILVEVARSSIERRVDAEEDYFRMIKPIAESQES